MQRILIQGIGGVGGLLAAELSRAGHELCLVTGNPTISAAINTNGLSLSTPESNFNVPARAYTQIEDVPKENTFDFAFSAMMAGAAVDAARDTLNKLSSSGSVVSFQNGFVEDAIGECIGIERVISATVALGSTMDAPGVYRRTTPGRLIIGELDGRESERIRTLETILNDVIATEVSMNIIGVLWGKLIWNGAVSGLCAISGYTLGDLFSTEIGRELFLIAFHESVSAARADEVRIEPVIVDPEDYFCSPHESLAHRRAFMEKLIPFVELYAGVTPSTLESLKRGRKSEIDFLNGYIFEKSRGVGLASPLNENLIPMVHEIEDGKRNISPENFVDLRDAIDDVSRA